LIASCFLPEEENGIYLTGLVLWNWVYLSISYRCFRERRPIYTRGGLVRYENDPVGYHLSYSILIFFGLFSLFVFFLIGIKT